MLLIDLICLLPTQCSEGWMKFKKIIRGITIWRSLDECYLLFPRYEQFRSETAAGVLPAYHRSSKIYRAENGALIGLQIKGCLDIQVVLSHLQ